MLLALCDMWLSKYPIANLYKKFEEEQGVVYLATFLKSFEQEAEMASYSMDHFVNLTLILYGVNKLLEYGTLCVMI